MYGSCGCGSKHGFKHTWVMIILQLGYFPISFLASFFAHANKVTLRVSILRYCSTLEVSVFKTMEQRAKRHTNMVLIQQQRGFMKKQSGLKCKDRVSSYYSYYYSLFFNPVAAVPACAWGNCSAWPLFLINSTLTWYTVISPFSVRAMCHSVPLQQRKLE